MSFKPMLASPVEWAHINPADMVLSPKYDGIRCIIRNGVAVSRALKPIPSPWVQRTFGRPEFEGFDGELIMGSPTSPSVYRDTNSAVMKQDSDVEVGFYVFDHITVPHEPYCARMNRILIPEDLQKRVPIALVEQHPLTDMAHLLKLEELYLGLGFEGVMLRRLQGPNSHYKFGRSTAKEGILLKLKRFEDDEATVIGFEEEMRNENQATTNSLGQTERSSHQSGMVGKGTLGNLICRLPSGVEFSIGSGFTAKDRKDLWAIRDTLIGRIVKFKSFPIGVKDRPRFPIYLGWRDPIDAYPIDV